MNNELADLYAEWMAEQNLVQSFIFEEEQELLNELASAQNSPDWSTWIQSLCS
jgi:hypothetical protein